MVRVGDILIQPLHIQGEACGRFFFFLIAKFNELWSVEWVWCCAWQVRSLYMSSVGISPRVCSGCALTALEGSTSAGALTWCRCPLFMCKDCLPSPFVLLLWENLLESIKGASENWRAVLCLQGGKQRHRVVPDRREQDSKRETGWEAQQGVPHSGLEWFSLAP